MSYRKKYFSAILRELFLIMIRIRKTEEAIVRLYPKQEMRCPVHLCLGQEAIPAGVSQALKPDDIVFCSHRSHGYYLARGGNLNAFMAELYGKLSGCTKGKGGSQHLIAPDVGLWGSSAVVAGTIPIAVGAAFSFAMQRKKSIAVVDFGDGATDEGVFYESLNFAALRRLPVIFICENNFYATHAHQSVRQAECNIYKKAEAFRMPGIQINGNDAIEVFQVCSEAMQRARSGNGPTLIECITYRWLEHVGPNYDYHLGYRSEKELKEWMGKCPIRMLKKVLRKRGLIEEIELVQKLKSINQEIEKAVCFAKKSKFPGKKELLKDVYRT